MKSLRPSINILQKRCKNLTLLSGTRIIKIWLTKHWPRSLKKFKNHPSIVKIKTKYLIQEKNFLPVSVKDFEKIIKNVPRNKASGGDIPIQILKQSGFTFQILTDCINDAIDKVLFPYSLKIANSTPAHKNDEDHW